MCYYRMFIFSGCGHSTFSSTPISYCLDAPSSPLRATVRRSSSTGESRSPTAPTSACHEMTSAWPLGEHRATRATCRADSVVERLGNSSLAPTNAAMEGLQPCAEARTHPFSSVRLERICAVCEVEREERLHALKASTDKVRLDLGRERWPYQRHNGALATKKSDTPRLHGKGKRGSGLWGIGTAVEGWWA